MNPGVTFYKKLKITSFNKRNGTIIRSVYANLKAKYGKNVRIDEGTYISEDVTIGDQSYVNANSRLQHCDVGKYCSISSNVNINPYNHNMRGLTTHPIGDVDREIKRVVIGNDVLISLNVTILEGVHIGDGAVIGAGAVVSHNVGDFEVWGGVPAKFIHYRVPDEKQREALAKTEWWNADDEIRDRYIDRFRSCLDGIDELPGGGVLIMYITVFTPVYNRGYCVRDVYISLVKQTYKSFEWLVINDGSSDDTEEVINDCIKENKINIRYIYQENGGQHRALNHAIKEAKGELFMIVDSDDTLESIALERIAYYEKTIQDKTLFAGVSGLRKHFNGEIIGTPWPDHKNDFIDIKNTDRMKKRMLLGDKAEAYYTHVLRNFFPIPEFEGENDVEKGVLWNRIASGGLRIRWFNEAIYNCEYLADGMSRNIIKNYLKNYNGYLLYIRELIHCDIGLYNKIKFFIKTAEIVIEKNDTASHFSQAVNVNLGLTTFAMGLAHITPIRFKMKRLAGGGQNK